MNECSVFKELLAVTSCCSSFPVHKEFVVPTSHSKSEPGQDLVWRDWLVACWP